ncbi:HepT-like ribonuclease domain-containing protein [Crocosphaera sp. XPORK-15E]|uniref:HepT-like ribonuclease domain-containing protein n=1 Tax=Crocosphaera sp. XPORK-15E TaxID=3110247 RepID=UPI002B210E23|nr:HepT-like ribonuclease domain-containing protein [Crocosphaera sp. XPORK-15E]MEA5533887.1 HepT-like ribonuclease domain-containing protein [Crocosphaera sp. XPORK-15E]
MAKNSRNESSTIDNCQLPIDKLIHNYFGVDYDIVWDAIINEVPLLDSKVREIVKKCSEL